MSFRILGTGGALPGYCCVNEDLSRFLDTSDEWISTRTGIRCRRVLTDETLTQLAVEAAKSALEEADLEPKELDYILCPTLGGDYITPSLACMVQAGLGASCPSVDLNAACSGFLYGLELAGGLFAWKKVRHVLVVAAEAMSRFVDWRDRSTCVLFGDGAGAAVLGEGDALLDLQVTAKGDDSALYVPVGQGNSPFVTAKKIEPYLRMNGQEIYKFAVSAICSGITGALERTGLSPNQVDHVLLHQANLRIIEAAEKKLSIPAEKYRCNIEKNGNLSAASIPLLLDECNKSGLLKQGDILVMSGFGAGLTTGTAVLRWGR